METKKKHAAHICNLIAMAMQDGVFHDNEMNSIIQISRKLGLSCSELERILGEHRKITLEIPEQVNVRIQHLYDLVKVMIADNEVDENEIKYISSFAKLYGFDFDENFKKNILQVDTVKLLNDSEFKKFINKFRILSGDQLSSVVVDQYGGISFPEYKIQNIHLTPLRKAIYIFFLLKNKSGQRSFVVSNLDSEEAILVSIYNKVHGSNPWEAEKTIRHLFDIHSPTFNSNKTKLNQSIRNMLPDDLCDEARNLYTIEKVEKGFGVKLDESHIVINDKFQI